MTRSHASDAARPARVCSTSAHARVAAMRHRAQAAQASTQAHVAAAGFGIGAGYVAPAPPAAAGSSGAPAGGAAGGTSGFITPRNGSAGQGHASPSPRMGEGLEGGGGGAATPGAPMSSPHGAEGQASTAAALGGAGMGAAGASASAAAAAAVDEQVACIPLKPGGTHLKVRLLGRFLPVLLGAQGRQAAGGTTAESGAPKPHRDGSRSASPRPALTQTQPHAQVTNQNKREYVLLKAHKMLVGTIEQQMSSIIDAFHSLIPRDLMDKYAFTSLELQLLVCGEQRIDIQDLQRNCK